ncbi:MAG: hypothetical protein K6G91_05955 [Kiritimatiellae bacterium]|nr:hypothetical protein [Kiritimatiellia bacterium]
MTNRSKGPAACAECGARRKSCAIVASVVAVVAASALLVYALRFWCEHDARFLSSFGSFEEQRASEVGDCVTETAFRRNGEDFVGVRYRLGKLPLSYLCRWLSSPYEPYLIFDGEGKCVDRTSNYNDDHMFVHRWPELFPGIRSCKCGADEREGRK